MLANWNDSPMSVYSSVSRRVPSDVPGCPKFGKPLKTSPSTGASARPGVVLHERKNDTNENPHNVFLSLTHSFSNTFIPVRPITDSGPNAASTTKRRLLLDPGLWHLNLAFGIASSFRILYWRMDLVIKFTLWIFRSFLIWPRSGKFTKLLKSCFSN